ncbi:peptidase, partial [Salmonella enterica]|nr:peptidase [Salmonella enterica]
DANDIRGYADLLDKLEKTLIPAYAAKTGKSAEELSAMLEAETWMNGKECVEQGFADELLAPVKAMARLESKRIEVMNMPENIKNMIIAPQGNTGKQPENVSEEQKRLSGISNIFSLSGDRHATLKMQCLEDASCTVEMARDKLLTEMAKDITPTNQLGGPQNSAAFHAGVFASNGNITGDAIRQGLYTRMGFEKAERGNPYVMMSLFDMAKASLVDRGIGISRLGTRSQIVNLAFTHSSSDFAEILGGGAELSALKGWQNSGETFQAWTKKGHLSNFREAKRVGLNGFSGLDKVPEGAEYKYITTGDSGVPIALATYGNIFTVTRQAIINDDLQQLTTIPWAMGRAAARTVGNLVYLALTGNGNFTDGKPLFHADHHNLIKGDMNAGGLDEARKTMRLQKDANGDAINVAPAFIIVPAALESAARRSLLSSSTLAEIGKNSDGSAIINQNPGIINVVKDMGEIIVEPRLDKVNSLEWYVAAAQGTDTIEVAYLDGVDTPYL